MADPVGYEVQDARDRDSREGVTDQYDVPQVLRLDVLPDRVGAVRERDRGQVDFGPAPAPRKIDCQRLRTEMGHQLVPAVRAETRTVDENERHGRPPRQRL